MKRFVGILASIMFSSALAHASTGKHFERVITVIFENNDYNKVMKAPFFRSLADQGANFSNIFALARPSQPNYFALTAGTTAGVDTNDDVNLDIQSIVDLLEAKGLTWKAYVEDFPGNCFKGSRSRDYARKHNPFISYTNIRENPGRCANIVNANEFDQDVANGSLPNYAFYVPNNKNSAHDTNIGYADRWYQQKFGPLVSDADFMKDAILVTTFDEAAKFTQRNQIYTSIVGPAIAKGSFRENVNLYSLLRMIEDNWSLGDLGQQDSDAQMLPDIWL